MRYVKPSQRPDRFDLNPWSPLSAGLVFAGLGPNRLAPAGTPAYEDSSPCGNHGSLIGYAGAGDAPADKWRWDGLLRRWTLGFDGSNDYVQLGASPMNTWTKYNAFTLAAWVKSAADQGTIFQNGNTSTWDGFWWSWGMDDANRHELQLLGTSGGEVYAETSSAASKNVWHHLVATSNGSGLGTGCKLYLDGVEQAYSGRGGGSAVMTQNRAWCIGAAAGGSGIFLSGQLGDVMAWNRAIGRSRGAAIRSRQRRSADRRRPPDPARAASLACGVARGQVSPQPLSSHRLRGAIGAM